MNVVCINDKDFKDPLKLIKEFPVKGETYTVVQRNHTQGFGLGYVLAELNNPPLPNGEPVGFSAKRFAPAGDVLDEVTSFLELEELQAL